MQMLVGQKKWQENRLWIIYEQIPNLLMLFRCRYTKDEAKKKSSPEQQLYLAIHQNQNQPENNNGGPVVFPQDSQTINIYHQTSIEKPSTLYTCTPYPRKMSAPVCLLRGSIHSSQVQARRQARSGHISEEPWLSPCLRRRAGHSQGILSPSPSGPTLLSAKKCWKVSG